MKRAIAMIIVAGLWAAGAWAADQTVTGVVSDSQCGAKHGMANMSDRECTQMCTSRGAQYVLVVGDKIYKLTNRDSDLKTHAGHTVNLTGDVKGDTIRVSKIEMPKDAKN
jgi:hypothetical protein